MDNHRRSNRCGDARCDCKCRDCCSCKPARCCKRRKPLPGSSCICPPGPPGPMGPPGPSGASGASGAPAEGGSGQLKFSNVVTVLANAPVPAGDSVILACLSDAATAVASEDAVGYPLAEAVVFDSLAARLGALTSGAVPAGIVIEVTLRRGVVDTGLQVAAVPGGGPVADYGLEPFVPLDTFDVCVTARNTTLEPIVFGGAPTTFLATAVLSQSPTVL